MQITLCGQVCEIPDDATAEERDRIRKAFVDKVTNDIPKEVFDEMCDKVWMEVYGELPASRKKELADEARRRRFNDGSFVVLSDDDIKAIQETMKADKEYEERLRREKKNKAQRLTLRKWVKLVLGEPFRKWGSSGMVPLPGWGGIMIFKWCDTIKY